MTITDDAFPVPTGLTTPEFVLRPITADDAENDFAAVMETRESLRLWEQSTWPEDEFTVEGNRKDLVDMEERHLAHRAYSYTVLDPGDSQCLGCVYIFPTSATFLTRAAVTAVGTESWDHVEAVVYFWVRLSRMATGMDERLLAELRAWVRSGWGLARVVFVVSEEFGQQLALFERTDLVQQFVLVEPHKTGQYRVFGEKRMP